MLKILAVDQGLLHDYLIFSFELIIYLNIQIKIILSFPNALAIYISE